MKEPNALNRNLYGDEFFTIKDDRSDKIIKVFFDYKCDRKKILWAQQSFLQLTCIRHHERGAAILVSRIETAREALKIIQLICEAWEISLPNKPLWNWTQKQLMEIMRPSMLRSSIDAESELYSHSRLRLICSVHNTIHKGKLSGKISDSLSFPLTSKLQRELMEPLLESAELTYAEWNKSKSFPPIPLGIASALLSVSIQILESVETKIALALFEAWRQKPVSWDAWFPPPRGLDIIRLHKLSLDDPFKIKQALESHEVGHVKAIPWKGRGEFRKFCSKLQSACINILFIQSGHRYAELNSSVSTEARRKAGTLLLKQAMGKTLNGIKVYRPIAKLSTQAATTLWELSCVDASSIPVYLIHKACTESACIGFLKGISDTGRLDSYTLNKRLNNFYKREVFSIIPEACELHPHLASHQFRHTFAEFTLRRFDEDVHESLREHFYHSSDHSTRVYEHNKLSADVISMLEKKYLFEIIGKAADGKLDHRFWGPAFKRLKNEIAKVKILSPQQAEQHYKMICSTIERFAVFEWGFCVLFKSSKNEAKCHDPVTGLPNVDGYACASKCTGCPNNMGNSIQKNNLIRIAVAHSDIAENHNVSAIGRLSLDIAEQITRRIGEV